MQTFFSRFTNSKFVYRIRSTCGNVFFCTSVKRHFLGPIFCVVLRRQGKHCVFNITHKRCLFIFFFFLFVSYKRICVVSSEILFFFCTHCLAYTRDGQTNLRTVNGFLLNLLLLFFFCFSQALKALCTRDNPLTANDRSDRNAMRLLPGEVGLTHERATFDFRDQRGPNRPVPVSAEHGGTVYYNVRPPTPPIDSTDDEQLRKHVVQMLPTASVKPVVGPVTGLPVGEDEHVLVFRFDKKPGEPDEKARLQIEVRTPKRKLILRKDASTQCNLSAVKTTDRAGSKKKKKKKKEEKTKSADKKKSGAKKKK